jgi:hypothetical protein
MRMNLALIRRGARQKRSAISARQISFAAIGSSARWALRHPTLARVGTGLAAALVGLCVLQFARHSHADKRVAAVEARDPARPVAAQPAPAAAQPAAVAEARQDPPAAAAAPIARPEINPPAPPLPPVRAKAAVAAADPALAAWFVKAYLRCWSPPATPPGGEKYAAQIRVVHKPDGSLSGAPVLVNPPLDPAWRAYADSAVRAVAKCPLQVPAQYTGNFDQWRKMTLHFSPDATRV